MDSGMYYQAVCEHVKGRLVRWLMLLLLLLLAGCASPATVPDPTPLPTSNPALTERLSPLPSPSPVPQSSASPAATAVRAHPARILMVTATSGYYHTSIPAAREAVQRLAAQSGAFVVTILPDVASLPRLTARELKDYEVVFFANTSGDLPLDSAQKQALLDYVRAGGGFVGV